MKKLVAAVVGAAAVVGGVLAVSSAEMKIQHCTGRLPDGGVIDVGPQRTLEDCLSAAGKAVMLRAKDLDAGQRPIR